MNRLLLIIFALVIGTNVLANKFDEPIITRFENSLESDLKRIQNHLKSRGTPTFASVGNGTECTHSTIQSAIDSGVDEVRVVHDHIYYENLTIIADRDFLLRGDFDSCSQANSNIRDFAGGISEINGTAFSSVITIEAPASGGSILPEITLWGFEVVNGLTGSDLDGAGVYMKSDVIADINLWSMDIHDNSGNKGGGLAIYGEGEITLNNTQIHNNFARFGGGIFCNNNSATIRNFSTSIASNVAATFNESAGQGGGIYASNQCVISLYNTPNGDGIVLNEAERQGGGIYATSGAKIYFTPQNVCESGGNNCQKTAMSLVLNKSDSDNSGNENGGGAFITGENTLLRILDGNIQGNKSGGHGGAISIENGARLSTDISRNCWNRDHCLYFAYNFAGEQSFGAGGAIFNSSSIAEINHVTFENNRADFGIVLYGTGLNSLTTINGSIINNNGDGGGNTGASGFSDNYVMRVVSDAVLHVLSSTIADNNATLSVFGLSASTTASSSVYSSIVNDADSGNVFSNSSDYNTDCILAHEIDSFLEDDGTSFVADPSFVDRANRDYHILPTSLAVDRCYVIFGAFPSDMLDIDLQPKGYDDPNQPNILGPFDIGADETYFNDIIFKHGFEGS